MESLVLALLIRGEDTKAIMQTLDISAQAVHFHARNGSRKIPGDLPARMRIHFWGRGATVEQLTGEGWMPGPPGDDVV